MGLITQTSRSRQPFQVRLIGSRALQPARPGADHPGVTTSLRTGLAALALAVAAVPAAAGPADAATKSKAKRVAAKTAVKKRAAKPVKPVAAQPATPAPAPAPAAAPTFTSVISIGGFVFYNVSYAEAVEAYQALIASGATPPPPVTSVSVTVEVGGSV
jgi:hypothetical protein